MSKSLEPIDNHIPGMINLLASSTVTKLNAELRNVFDELATRYLSRESESRLSGRLRKYDNYQRLAFGFSIKSGRSSGTQSKYRRSSDSARPAHASALGPRAWTG